MCDRLEIDTIKSVCLLSLSYKWAKKHGHVAPISKDEVGSDYNNIYLEGIHSHHVRAKQETWKKRCHMENEKK